jgi:hypothetical protein
LNGDHYNVKLILRGSRPFRLFEGGKSAGCQIVVSVATDSSAITVKIISLLPGY